MSGFSSPEFLLIVVLALVVLGPKRLPEIANKIGNWVGQARRMTRVMKRQLEEELNVDDLNQIASPRAASAPARKTTRSTAEVTEGDAVEQLQQEAAEKDAPPPDHIPNDDDSFSPVHAKEDAEKSA
jgi:sec-independent protein translocase protein TatB